MIVPKNPGDLVVTTVEFPPWCCLLKNCLTLPKQLKEQEQDQLRKGDGDQELSLTGITAPE